MARLAATDFGADWVINADADEFWWPNGESLKDVLAAVPAHVGVVRGAWRNFVPRPDDGHVFFAERMTVRYCAPAFHPHPLSTHLKSVHRAAADVRVGRGNHEAFGSGLNALRGWFPFEILHFPVRSLEHCRRKYVTQFVALERNAEKGIPGHMADAYRAYLADDLDSFYAPLVVDDARARPRCPRRPVCGRHPTAGSLARARIRRERRRRRSPEPFRGRSVEEAAAFAGEYSALEESDLGLALGARADGVDSRLAVLERSRLGEDPRRAFRRPDLTSAWQRLLAFVPTRRAAVVLVVAALAVFWLEALGWPMAKGRDTWDYLVYYLQLADGDPPISELQLFRTPLTPIVVGAPMHLGGSALLEVVFGVLYAVTILAWSATALTFGRVPALFTAALLLVYPAFATIYHQASSDAVFATGLALWALLLARTMRTPSAWRFAAVGAGMAVLVLIRPANQALLPLALVPLLVPVAWSRRVVWSGVCLAGALALLGGWAIHNGVRYDDTTVARGGRAWVPFLRVFLADRTISPENGDASRRLADLIETEVLAKEPHRSLNVPLDAYLRNGSNYETVRLIALSDEVLGERQQLRRHLRLGPRGDPREPWTYARGVADTFWEFLMQRPLREDIAPARSDRNRSRRRGPSRATASCFRIPQAYVLVEAVPYGFVWCASDYFDSCVLDAAVARLGRSRDATALPRGRRSGQGVGCGAALTDGVDVRDRGVEPHHATFPAAAALARRGLVALLCVARRSGARSSSCGSERSSCCSSTLRRRASLRSSRCRSIRSSS